MAEMKKLLKIKKNQSLIDEEKNNQLVNDHVEKLPKLTDHINDKNINLNTDKQTSFSTVNQVSTPDPSTSKMNENSLSIPLNVLPALTTSYPVPTYQTICENCDQCICRNWRSRLTPEYVLLCEEQLRSMQKFISKNNPSNDNNDRKVELSPNTGIFLTQQQLDLAMSKANSNYRDLVRNLLSHILRPDELIAFKTAESMNKSNGNIRSAIIGYLRDECSILLSTVEFNDIVRRKIYQTILDQKPLEEIQKIKSKSCDRAKKSRERRKLMKISS